jgi:hypothetical protein
MRSASRHMRLLYSIAAEKPTGTRSQDPRWAAIVYNTSCVQRPCPPVTMAAGPTLALGGALGQPSRQAGTHSSRQPRTSLPNFCSGARWKLENRFASGSAILGFRNSHGGLRPPKSLGALGARQAPRPSAAGAHPRGWLPPFHHRSLSLCYSHATSGTMQSSRPAATAPGGKSISIWRGITGRNGFWTAPCHGCCKSLRSASQLLPGLRFSEEREGTVTE